MKFIHSSMFGSFVTDCEVIDKPELGAVRIRFYDANIGEERECIIRVDELIEDNEPVHDVKSWAHFFDAIVAGEKTHELRDNDRNYQVGDIMLLRRYDNINGKFTGETCKVIITYITNRERPCAFSGSVLDPRYCILSIRKLD